LLMRPGPAVGTENVKRENRQLCNPTLATQGWGTLMSLSGESGFSAKPWNKWVNFR
jgi:hypothetical protein